MKGLIYACGHHGLREGVICARAVRYKSARETERYVAARQRCTRRSVNAILAASKLGILFVMHQSHAIIAPTLKWLLRNNGKTRRHSFILARRETDWGVNRCQIH